MESKFKQLSMKENPTEVDAAAAPWTELPSDVTANILQRLGTEEILESAQFVCATWWKICKNPVMWRMIKIGNLKFDVHEEKLVKMCRRAVDRSQGQLIDVTIIYSGDDESLLGYIARRSRKLRRLTVSSTHNISDCLSEVVKKLPELEELHLHHLSYISAEDIETIGNSCTKLKSFSFYGGDNWFQENEEALAISKNMPNLRSLGLFSNALNNEGLQAILDGCPYLESLDLRLCKHVDLEGELGVRCRQQIKNLRLPSDSNVDDYEREFNQRAYDEYCEFNYLSDCDDYDRYHCGDGDYDAYRDRY